MVEKTLAANTVRCEGLRLLLDRDPPGRQCGQHARVPEQALRFALYLRHRRLQCGDGCLLNIADLQHVIPQILAHLTDFSFS